MVAGVSPRAAEELIAMCRSCGGSVITVSTPPYTVVTKGIIVNIVTCSYFFQIHIVVPIYFYVDCEWVGPLVGFQWC